MKIVMNDKQKLLSQSAIENARSKAISLFAKFGHNVKSIEIMAQDVNGPRSGVDKECLVVVKMRRMQDVAAKASDTSLTRAIPAAINRAGRAVGRRLGRRAVRENTRQTGLVLGRS